MTSRIRLHSDKIKDPTSASVRSELPANAEGEPYICRFPDTEDSDVGKGLVAYWTAADEDLVLACLIVLALWTAARCISRWTTSTPMCISAELEELPEIPGLYLAKMGAFKGNVRMCVYGTEMDVCKTNAGVKALKYWKTDPLEIALYERGLLFLQVLLV